MGWLGESEYNCPECEGGLVECPVWSIQECEHCHGTGWDPERVDVVGFKAACDSLNEKMFADSCANGSWEWIGHKTNTRLGRDGGKFGRVAVADFLLETKCAECDDKEADLTGCADCGQLFCPQCITWWHAPDDVTNGDWFCEDCE